MGALAGFNDRRFGRILMISSPFILLATIWCVNEFLNGTSGGFVDTQPDPSECIKAHMRIDEINYEISQLEAVSGSQFQIAELWIERTWLEYYYGHCSAYGDH